MRDFHQATYALDPGGKSKKSSYERRSLDLVAEGRVLKDASSDAVSESAMAFGKERAGEIEDEVDDVS